MFHFKLSQTLFYLTNTESVHLWYWKHKFLTSDKAVHKPLFSIINNKYSNQVSVIKPRNHWNTVLYQGSDNNFEGDRESDLNSLASEILGNPLQ